MSTDNTTQEEVLEENEQEELVEAPEQDEQTEQAEVKEGELPPALQKAIDKKKGKDDDEDDDEDDDDEEEEDESTKKEELKIPSTKSAMVKAIFDKVNGLKKEEVGSRFKELISVIEAEDLGGETVDDAKPDDDSTAIGKKKKKIKISMPEINVKEDIEALVEGEELSDDFKSKHLQFLKLQFIKK